jgi:hypothetical protein
MLHWNVGMGVQVHQEELNRKDIRPVSSWFMLIMLIYWGKILVENINAIKRNTEALVVCDDQILSFRFHGSDSVYTAECYAIYRAVLIRHQSVHCHFLCSDPLNISQSPWTHTPTCCYGVCHIRCPIWITPGNQLTFAGCLLLQAYPATRKDALHENLCERSLGSDVRGYRAVLSCWHDELTHTQGNKFQIIMLSVQLHQERAACAYTGLHTCE